MNNTFLPWGALLFAAALAAQQPARDNATAPVIAGTATISGTILVNGPTKQPARRVRVTLNNLARTSPGQTTTTDDSGAFAFRDVPAGQFEVQAIKTGFLRASYGAGNRVGATSGASHRP
jgi:Carboxypeptidase regulatory-like domain